MDRESSNETNEVIIKINENQYFTQVDLGEEIVNKYLNSFHYIFHDLKSPFTDGYTIRELIDNEGTFYIIHPDEYKIKRYVVSGRINNIINNVILFTYSSPKISKSIERLLSIKYLYFEKIINPKQLETEYIYIKKFSYYKIIDDILKEENEIIGFLLKNQKEDDIIKMFKTLLVSKCYDCEEEVIQIIALMYSIGSYRTFIRKQKLNPKYNDYDKFISKWQDSQSELFSYLKIMNFFISAYKKMSITTKKISKNHVEKSFNTYTNLLKKYGNKIFLNKNSDELKKNGITKNEIDLFTKYYNNKYNSEKRYNDYSSNVTIKPKQNSNSFNYDLYCQEFFIDTKIIIDAIKLYNIFKKIMSKNEYSKYFKEFKKIYSVKKSLSKKENIIKCFLESYLSNLSIFSNSNITNIILDNKLPAPKISLVNLSKSLIFFGLRTNDELLGLTKVDAELVDQVMPLYLLDYKNEYLVEEPVNLLNITSKYNYHPDVSSTMNVFIDGLVKIVKVKKYRFNIIKN
jgi:hypothetical protein